jgi:hypothetical protein
MRRLALFALLFLPCIGVASTASKKSETATAKASLDLLVTRIEDYWRQLAQGSRDKAVYYIIPSDRKKFFSVTAPKFRNPRFRSVEVSDNRNEATVTVMVKRIVPPLPTEIDWPVKDKWRFEKGTWYCLFDPQFLPMLNSVKSVALSPEQLETSQREIRKRLQFEKSEFEFGTVNQGEDVVLNVKYRLEGSDPMLMRIRSSAPGSECPQCTRERGIGIRGAEDQKFLPGPRQELSVEVPTWNFDGDVKEQFTLFAKLNGVEVPFEFSVRGIVYTPLSISPKFLRFKPGEREKEILLRNNSKSDLKLEQVLSETKALTLDPFPATIPPGGQLKAKVKAGESLDYAAPNAVDRVAITYRPIDGFSGISYKVYLNSRGETPATSMDKNIRELILQNQIILPEK